MTSTQNAAEQGPAMRFTIATTTDSRSNRADRTYTVIADHADDARSEAQRRGERDVRQHVSVWTEIIDVDGRGAPVHCPHEEARLLDGFIVRPDGGEACHTCAREEGSTR